MTQISDERIREVIAQVKSWRVYSDERGMVCDDLALICRALLAAREEAKRLRGLLKMAMKSVNHEMAIYAKDPPPPPGPDARSYEMRCLPNCLACEIRQALTPGAE